MKQENIVYLAEIFDGKKIPLALVNDGDGIFYWCQDGKPTDVVASSSEEAFKKARKKWKEFGFQPVLCGTKFTLPERDEHGSPASYQDMRKSLASMNGVYFDEALGHNCIVRDIPISLIKKS